VWVCNGHVRTWSREITGNRDKGGEGKMVEMRSMRVGVSGVSETLTPHWFRGIPDIFGPSLHATTPNATIYTGTHFSLEIFEVCKHKRVKTQGLWQHCVRYDDYPSCGKAETETVMYFVNDPWPKTYPHAHTSIITKLFGSHICIIIGEFPYPLTDSLNTISSAGSQGGREHVANELLDLTQLERWELFSRGEHTWDQRTPALKCIGHIDLRHGAQFVIRCASWFLNWLLLWGRALVSDSFVLCSREFQVCSCVSSISSAHSFGKTHRYTLDFPLNMPGFLALHK